jgi:hypothetical protein
LGAQHGQAGYVDHSSGGVIALLDTNWDYPVVLLDNGEIRGYDLDAGIWNLNVGDSQRLCACPVPTSPIKFIDDHHAQRFISTSNELWYLNGTDVWINAGSPSGGLATQPTTWG